jgi:hypothetical protein
MQERERIIEEIRIREELRLRKTETWWQRLRRQVENARKEGISPDAGEIAMVLATGRANMRAYYTRKQTGEPLSDADKAFEARRRQLARHFEHLHAAPTAPTMPQQGPHKAAELPRQDVAPEPEIPRGFQRLKPITRPPKPSSVWH